jgi:hypothetical protein
MPRHGQTGSAGALRPAAWAAMTLAALSGCATLPWGRREVPPEPPKAVATPAPPPAATPDNGKTASNSTPQPSRDAGKGPVIPASSQEPADPSAASPLPPPRPLFPPAENGSPGPAIGSAPFPLANTLVAPTAGGGLLNLAPQETAIQRAVELAQRLGIVEAERQALAIHVRQLEAALEARDRMLAESAREVEQATAEMAATRKDLSALRKELAAVADRTRQSEKADLDSMKAILASLEKLLAPDPGKDRPSEGRQP